MKLSWFVSLFFFLLLGSATCPAGWQADLDAAKAATESGKIDEAVRLYRQALSTGEVPVEPFMDTKEDTVFSVGFSLAYLLDAKGDVEGAIARLNDLKETYIPVVTKEDDVMGEWERDTILLLFFPRISELYAKNEQYDQAIAVLEEGLALSSLDPLHADLAWLLAAAPDRSLRNAEKALEHAQIAVDTNRNSDGLSALAAAYAEGGNLQEAVKHQEEAIAAEKSAEKPSAETLLALDKQLAIYRERVGPSAPVAEAESVATAVMQDDAEQAAAEDATAAETEAQPAIDHADLSKKQVRDLQKKLSVHGYNPGRIDGRWGKRTEAALKRMQEDRGLPVTGQLDAATQDKLGL